MSDRLGEGKRGRLEAAQVVEARQGSELNPRAWRLGQQYFVGYDESHGRCPIARTLVEMRSLTR